MAPKDNEVTLLGEKIDALGAMIERLRQTIEALTDAIDDLGEGEAARRARRGAQVEKLVGH